MKDKMKQLLIQMIVLVRIGCHAYGDTDIQERIAQIDQSSTLLEIREKLSAAKLTQAELVEVARNVDGSSTDLSKQIAIAAVVAMAPGSDQRQQADRFVQSDNEQIRLTAILLLMRYWPQASKEAHELIKRLAATDELFRAAISLGEDRADELRRASLDSSELVRAATARRIGLLLVIKKIDELAASTLLTRLMVDHDALVRSNAVVASRELRPESIEPLVTLLEGMTIDVRAEVLLEDLFSADADPMLTKQYLPQRHLDDPWTRSQFIALLIEKAPATVPTRGFEEHIILNGSIRIGWRAATILRVLAKGRSQAFFDELKRAHDPAFERAQIFE